MHPSVDTPFFRRECYIHLMKASYPTPAATHEAEIEIKKSRFIARALKITNRPNALAAVEQIKYDYPDARHYCWAYLLGNPAAASNAGMNDDGEPSGTAGKPILNVIQHKGVGDVLVIVVRYFGGIKLGAGGLVRAYSSAAEAVMSTLSTSQAIAMMTLKLELEFSQEQHLRHWGQQHALIIDDIVYAQAVTIEAQLPLTHLAALHEYCAGRNIVCTTQTTDED